MNGQFLLYLLTIFANSYTYSMKDKRYATAVAKAHFAIT